MSVKKDGLARKTQLEPGLRRVWRLLSKERYGHALAVLDQLPVDTQQLPAALWMRGAALHGTNQHNAALDALRAAWPNLEGLDQALCVMDVVLTLIKMARLDEATEQIAFCRQIYWAQEAVSELAICDFLDLLVSQRKELHSVYLNKWRQISDSFLELGKANWYVYAYAQASFSLRVLGQFKEAQKIASEILPLARKLGLVYRQAQLWFINATCYLILNKPRKALRALTTCENLCRKTGAQSLMAEVLQNKSLLLESAGDLKASLLFSRQAVEIHKSLGLDKEVAWGLTNLAAKLNLQGEIQQAGAHFQEAYNLADKLNDSRLRAEINMRMAYIHTLIGQMAEARTLWEEVIQDASTGSVPAQHIAIASAYLITLCSSEEFDTFCERAQKWLNDSQPSNYLSVAQRILAEQLTEKHRWDEARPLLMSAIKESLQWPQQNATALIRLAECDLDELTHRPVAPNDAPRRIRDIRQKLRNIKRQARLLPDLSARVALVEADLAQMQNEPTQALAHLKEAIQNLRVIRLSGDDPVLTSALAATFDPVYWRGARLAHELNDEDALVSFVEHRRAQWLARALNVRSPGPAPSPELDDVRRALYQLRKDTAARPNEEQVAAFRAGLEETARRYDQMNLALMFAPAAQTQMSPLRRPIPVAGNAELRAAFNARFGDEWTAITLEPVSADGSEWLLLRLTPREFSHRTLAAGTVIRKLLQTLSDADARFRRRFFGARAQDSLELRMLSDWLGAGAWVDKTPSGANLPALLVADASWLSRLPLGSLPVDEQRSLGECAALRFAPSLNTAAMLCYTHPNNDEPANWRTLVVAPASFNGRLPDLPSGPAEVAALRKLWPGATVLAGQDATLAGLRALAENGDLAAFDAIFFATHANSEPRHLRLSGLAMLDGDITFQEMLSWKLNAQLVCLLACDSSFSISRGGEERLGIETALIASGAKTVLSSRWPVKEEAAPPFITAFMRHYLAVKSAAQALVLAQQELAAGDMAPSDIAAWRITGAG